MTHSDKLTTEDTVPFSELDTMVLTYDVRHDVTVTPDTDHVSFVKSHRTPIRVNMHIMFIVIGAVLLASSLFGMGTVLGVSIAR